ncbi:hypothetical protein EDD21DRAFT_382278 [Dissophora ornata]|nr:hypothetical protein BGZ58_007558 [Dissophora ornata]KAI8598504.1 hypothetical protein EDD21DRAFT_382278 [Dissophora ornata]
MKIPLLLSVTALMAVAVAQPTNVDPASDITYVDPPAGEVIDMPFIDLADNENDDPPPKPGMGKFFTAWSSPGFKGHKQRNKNTPGCYRLDGGAVGSFEGDTSMMYAFYQDSRCKEKRLYGWSDAPIRRFDPIIYPYSVKILEKLPHPRPPRFSLVAWSRILFSGDRQLVRGLGCQALNGSDISSFQGEYKYTFFDGPNCYGKKLLESKGGKSIVRSMSPRSVYITE